MLSIKNKEFYPDCSHNDCDIDDYYLRDKTFGYFSEEGRAYVITDRNTPRYWVQYLCNDKIRSAVSNTGRGYIFYDGADYVTKQHEYNGNYMPRNVNGQRSLLFTVGDKTYDFFYDAEEFLCTVRPGYVTYTGTLPGLLVRVVIFVAKQAPVECWCVDVQNVTDADVALSISAVQHLNYVQGEHSVVAILHDQKQVSSMNGAIGAIFTASRVDNLSAEAYTELLDVECGFTKETLTASFVIGARKSIDWNVLSIAYRDQKDIPSALALASREESDRELSRIQKGWDEIISANYCELPDQNLQNFLNVWLKNQIHLTFRYDRGGDVVGYRDGLQDTWGNLLVEPKRSRERLLLCLSYMMADGRCPRQFDKYGSKHDMRDFADSPIWAPIALNGYIKETGDRDILNTVIPYLDSDEKTSVEEHIDRALNYLYHSRGKNGLILMRGGDWADGLAGINRYGADATSVWMTIAAFYAQNMMQEIYEYIGDRAKAERMAARSAEYKELVNRVGWDGSWLSYAFFEDGEPIGSHKNLEGKIWLNPQTWGIFTGIIDDERKIRKMASAVSRYLDTPYGAMVNYPPYVFYGERCGRIQRQRPGMFLNSSVYNHAASFKVFSDVARGAYDDAWDTLSRCLPNHPDNSDTRRTSEPFAVGNVYYGPDHPRQGMNLFTWFTASPSWLIHGGFSQILGVTPTFKGLTLEPHVSEDWDSYSVTKLYRGTLYHIHFVRSEEETGVWMDGVKQKGNTVYSKNKIAEVTVKF